MINVEHLSKQYGSKLAIDDVTFSVGKGEILGLLGPNAAGKTTTMRILTGFLAPTSGRATVAGYDVVTQSLAARRRVGYLPETIPLYPEMTVVEYLTYMATIRGVPSNQRAERVQFSLEQCNLTEVGAQLLGRLSRGYRQRVGIAQAIVHDPDVLILDEPTVGLDPHQIVETRALIKGLGGDRTIILSTHILPEVSMTCSRVLIINRGKVVAEDTPENLSRRLAGADRLLIEVRGPAEAVENSIAKMPEVISLKLTSADGLVRLEVETAAGRDLREQLARQIVEAGWGLLELRQAGASLEEVFVHLTTTEQEAQEG